MGTPPVLAGVDLRADIWDADWRLCCFSIGNKTLLSLSPMRDSEDKEDGFPGFLDQVLFVSKWSVEWYGERQIAQFRVD